VETGQAPGPNHNRIFGLVVEAGYFAGALPKLNIAV
jgi:hypothetical protein